MLDLRTFCSARDKSAHGLHLFFQHVHPLDHAAALEKNHAKRTGHDTEREASPREIFAQDKEGRRRSYPIGEILLVAIYLGAGYCLFVGAALCFKPGAASKN